MKDTHDILLGHRINLMPSRGLPDRAESITQDGRH